MGRARRDSLTTGGLGLVLGHVRASYWAIPAALTVLALGAALALLAFDHARAGGDSTVSLPYVGGMDAPGARSLIAIVAQSIFGVTGVMFSMTIVAVSFATGKYGPRLIGNFMRDRVNQWSLGVLTATFVFALVVARSIREGDPGTAFVPQASILVTLVLTFACIGIVIYFVHHVPELIDISRLTADIGRNLIEDVRALAEAQARDATADDVGARWPETPPDATLLMERSGYVEAIDLDRLRALAGEAGLRIAVVRPVGSFAGTATQALRLWGPAPDAEMRERLLGSIVIGDTPSADHNLLHRLDQLVEITARALSPGVNDPFTAINCIHWMYAATLAAAIHADGLTGAQSGPVRLPPLRLADVLEHGFGASRAYTRTDRLSDLQVRDSLAHLLDEVPPGPHHDTIRRFTDALDDDEARSAA